MLIKMKVLFLTNEYPPNIYGGAGVHVEYLTQELSSLLEVDVRCFGDQTEKKENLQVQGHPRPDALFNLTPDNLRSPLGAISRNISFNSTPVDADIVHCHTWYTHFGGILAKLLYGIPLVITTHSLEPLRPWKREQLGRGYDFSSWVEKTALKMADAIIAVSTETKKDILNNFDVAPDKIHNIANGIDIEGYKHTDHKTALDKYNIPKDLPFVLFVGRITRQKGISYLINAIKHVNKNVGVVLCAGAPDTKEIADEIEHSIKKMKQERNNVFWIHEMVPKNDMIQLYSAASLFCCPSIYEPFGIINLEAMACETPVVGSKVGGIQEIIKENETGILIPFEQQKTSPFEPLHPDKFSTDLAAGINTLMENSELRSKFAEAGRKRVEQVYSWKNIAEEVFELYKSLSTNRERI